MKIFITTLIFLTFYFHAQSQSNIKSGYDVITAMHNAYKGNKWYKYFTFSQETYVYKEGKKEKMEIWHEAADFPGKLLIKFNTKDSKNGLLFADHKINIFTEGKEPVSKPKIHELLVAAFDVYFLKPEETIHIFDSLGYNLKLVREDVFENRKVFVVGAEKNDSTSKQFWIDAERLYLHKIIYTRGNSINDCVFGDYEKIGNYWVAKLITFKTDGEINTVEKYFDIKFPENLSKEFFDPKKFNEVKLE